MVLSCKMSFTPLHFFPTNIIARMFSLSFHRSTFNLHILLTGKRADAPCLAYARKKKKKLADPLHLPALVCLSWMWTGRRSAICSSSPSDVRGRRAGPERKRRKRHILAAAPLSLCRPGGETAFSLRLLSANAARDTESNDVGREKPRE